jgi:very-short-patch-repair endonuclease
VRQVAGREADLVWRQRKLIVEIDSKEWHQFTDLDAAKQARWEAAGYTVRRIMANDVYRRPEMLLVLVNGHFLDP